VPRNSVASAAAGEAAASSSEVASSSRIGRIPNDTMGDALDRRGLAWMST
jgi:hypothetical protein